MATQADQRRLDRLREVALRLPETHEQEAWGHPTFRVRKKMFAATGYDAQTITFKADAEELPALLGDEKRFFVPAYVGHKGWVGMNLVKVGRLDWDEISELLETAWHIIAPKTLARRWDEEQGYELGGD